MSKKKTTSIVPYESVDSVGVEVDLSYMFEDDKQLRSIKVDHNGEELWLAKHHTKGKYWTSNPKDPKILNTVHTPPRARGNILFKAGDGNQGGRHKGDTNRISIQRACAKMNANPAEFLAAVMAANIGELKGMRVKNPGDLTLAMRMKAAEILLNKTVPNLKPVDTDAEGNILGSTGEKADDNGSRIQVYIPGVAPVQISATPQEASEIAEKGLDAYLTDHKGELVPADTEDDKYVWEAVDDAK